MDKLRILIIAGPNGAGKTTFAREFLTQEANCPTFINADLIAAGLSPFEPEKAAMQAGRLMLQTMSAAVAQKKSFAFETTLAGISYARKIPKWQSLGYHISLIFLKLNNVDIAIDRIRERVRQGGHSIPEPVIRRRYIVGWKNFQVIYSGLVNDWTIFDNSFSQSILLDWGENYE
jgi:predicted ABC-type ATPase